MSPDVLMRARQAYASRDFSLVLTLLQPLTARIDAPEPVLAMAANAALLSERYPLAVELLLRLRALQPGNPAYARIAAQAYNRIGVQARRQRQSQAAEDALLSALAQWPDHPEALFNLASLRGECHQYALALPLWQRLHALTPDDHDVARELVMSLGHNGQHETASRLFARVAPPAADQPESAIVHAQAAAWVRRWQDVDALLGELQLGVDHSTSLARLAEQLLHAGQVGAAGKVQDRIVQVHDNGRIAPGLQALFQRHLMIAPVSDSKAMVEQQLQRYRRGLQSLAGELEEATADPGCQRRLQQLAYNNFYLAYQHSDGRQDRELQDKLGQLLAQTAPGFAAASYRSAQPRADAGQRRIGLVSAHFRRCTAGRYFGSWIAMLRDAGHEVHLFQLGPDFDDYTEALGRSAARLHTIDGDADELADVLLRAQCDLLIYPELGMDKRLIPLAALRLAPRQACAWGHPVTSGLSTMDAFFSCADMEPPSASNHYTETLLLLPGLGTDYHPPEMPPATSREELGLPSKGRLYFLPHTPHKMHVDSDPVWAAIAATDPQAVLVLFRGSSPALLGPLHERLHQALLQAGAEPERQLHILPVTAHARFLQIAQACDVMVDTLHWSGGNSTIDALLCGLPVVTCEGTVMRARQSAAMLRRIGLPELIVADPEQLAATAVAIAKDTGRRQALSRHILDHLPALFDATGVAQALAGHVDRLLHDWPDAADR
ncbi:MAG: hypothetical protein M0Q42_03330 [Xanthomonadales bacterium]|nr:hypothetical protein [Xanthomonadales bacterium]